MSQKIHSSHQTPSVISKYLNIILYIVFLLAFMGALLIYNIYMSSRIAKDTVAINLASRQSVLVQEMAKDVMNIDLMTDDIIQKAQEALLLQSTDGRIDTQKLTQTINQNVAQSDEIHDALDELRISRDLFDATLSAFARGGQTQSLTNENVVLEKVSNEQGLQSIQNSQETWAPYLRLMDSFLSSLSKNELNKEAIGFTVDYARIFNGQLLYEANDLVKALEHETQKKTQMLQWVQTGGIAVIVLFFFMIVFGALRRLLKTDAELTQAREQTTQILATVKEGLFLIDSDLVIASQYSDQLEHILGHNEIAGVTLDKLLERLISKKNFQVTEEFIEQLFNDDVIEELIWELNPLDRVRVYINQADGEKNEERILSFNFTRVYDEHEHITNVLVSVADITRQTVLEERLEHEKQRHNHQLELLSSILNMPHETIQNFLRYVKNCCHRINQILMQPSANKNDLLDKANAIFREAHGLKGESSSLKMRHFVSLAEEMENAVKQIKEMPDLTGQDFTALAINLESILQLNHQIEAILERMNAQGGKDMLDLIQNDESYLPHLDGKIHEEALPSFTSAPQSEEERLTQFIHEIASRNHKNVEFTLGGYEQSASLGAENQAKLREILIQLLRNAVVHGIETPQERQQQLKTPTGYVSCHFSQEDHELIMLVEDDGQGIRFEQLKEKAEQEGFISAFDDENQIKRKLMQYLFKSGISTESHVHEDAGQGVGMDLVKQRLKELNGSISLSSKENKGTIFKIRIPLMQKNNSGAYRV